MRIFFARARFFLALFFIVMGGGCASIPDEVSRLEKRAATVELVATPFFPQERFQCGPAALATILTFSGVQADLRELTERVYVPGRQGSLQVELLAATRAAERIPYVVDGTAGAIYDEVAAGRPVLVLQNLGVSAFPRWHYAVVVGIDPDRQEVLLRSGTERRKVMALRTFLHTWRRSEYWGFVSLRPGELPIQADVLRYFETVAGMESTGHRDSAYAGWAAAVESWPSEPVALFGLANAEYAKNRFVAAETLYRRLLELRPHDLMAGNNLALALMRQGNLDLAMEQIQSVLEKAEPDNMFVDEFATTRRQVESAMNRQRIVTDQ